jgi:Gluconate kinase
MSPTIAVIFGRPGAGKTTIATKAVDLYNVANPPEQTSTPHRIRCLDLDVCIPQWMRDNFAKGIYPTLEQRNDFALEACAYVEERLATMRQSDKVIISFSFVNSDLREIFKGRFPSAKWFLVDTSIEEARNRIQQRENHFYKGEPTDKSFKHMKEKGSVDSKEKDQDGSNSEWDFEPVDFDHILLDGLASIDENANKVLESFQS